MDLTSLYYFSEVAKDLHITKTANRLFISQQTLSNHILRLEQFYGAKLLYRKPKLTLTDAGEQVLLFAQKLNQEQTNLTDVLSDIGNQKRGVIRFGAGTMRMNILSEILPEFYQKYPYAELRLSSYVSTGLESKVLDGELDFAISISEESKPELIEEHLMADQIYLCVHDRLLYQYYGAEAEALKRKAIAGANVADFSRLPFCIFTNRMGNLLRSCFEEAGVVPQTRMTTQYTQICTEQGFRGLMAIFASQANLVNRMEQIPQELNIFPMFYQGEPMYLQVSLIRHRQRYLTQMSKYLLNLLITHASQTEQKTISRIAGKA